jgi:hypothetical protein
VGGIIAAALVALRTASDRLRRKALPWLLFAVCMAAGAWSSFRWRRAHATGAADRIGELNPSRGTTRMLVERKDVLGGLIHEYRWVA